jgi:putative ABC transport system ATP-binding protein
MTVMVITHNAAIAQMADKIIKMKNGKVHDFVINQHPVAVEGIEW